MLTYPLPYPFPYPLWLRKQCIVVSLLWLLAHQVGLTNVQTDRVDNPHSQGQVLRLERRPQTVHPEV